MDFFNALTSGTQLSLSSLLALEADNSANDFSKMCMSDDSSIPMLIGVVTDEMISSAKLKPCTDSMPFQKGVIPTTGGIFSNEIFGSTPNDRQRTCGYIDLSTTTFHPYVFEMIAKLLPKRLLRCASGHGSWIIDETGNLVEITDKDSPDYDQYSNGMDFLIENFDKMVFTKNKSITRNDRVDFISNLKKDEIFINKWIVVPVFFRDVDTSTGSIHKLPELDVEYNNLIRYSNSMKNSTFDFYNNQTKYNMQMELIKIRKRGQSLLEKKNGFIHKSVIGKSIDRGSRDVISTNIMKGCKKPSDNPINVFNTGIPLAKSMIMGYNFVLHYLQQFFVDNFKDLRTLPVYGKNKDGERVIIKEVPIKDQLNIFTTKYLEKKINRYKNSHETRFELIEIETEDGNKIPFHFTGLFGTLNSTSTAPVTRPMTWTDLFYMAAHHSVEGKFVWITRYPITSMHSMFPTRVHIMSTINTCSATINGYTYKHYPVIDLDHIAKGGRISNLFNDTVNFSNLYLDAIGGDFDGDMTSEKLCFTIEANDEAERIMTSLKCHISPGGSLIKVLGNEAYLTFYNMTRRAPVGKPATEDQKRKLLAIDKDEFTTDMFTALFGKSTKLEYDKDGKRLFNIKEPEFDLRSPLTLEAGEYTNKNKIETTVGSFIFNKIMIEGNIDHIFENGFVDGEMNKGGFGSKVRDIVSRALMDGKIQVVPHLEKFLNANEFWGLGLSSAISPSYSIETIVPNKKINKLKEEMLKGANENTPLAKLVEIEENLTKAAHDELETCTGIHMFDSGARGSFGNDYKNMALSVGAVFNEITGKPEFMKSSYMDGIEREDIAKAANSIVNAEYPKAVGTATGGYMSKQFYAVYQSIIADEYGSDCGSTMGITVTLTERNINSYLYQYVITPKGIEMISTDNKSKFINKTVKLRSPMYCKSPQLCNKCVGDRSYKIDLKYIGLMTPALAGALQNASLKLRHSMKINMDKIDINTLFLK